MAKVSEYAMGQLASPLVGTPDPRMIGSGEFSTSNVLSNIGNTLSNIGAQQYAGYLQEQRQKQAEIGVHRMNTGRVRGKITYINRYKFHHELPFRFQTK